MSHKIDLVRVLTAATGNSSPITLGAAYSQLFMTPAEAGAIDGRTYTWLIVDGNNWELVKGAYTASGTTMARTTVLASRSGGTLGTSRITLSGTAQVRIIAAAEDMDGVRGTRVVSGTSDTLSNTDQGYVVTYSNASAIAASLAQAGASNLFLDGWATRVKNTGAGTLTITPATSTINGGATLVLAQNLGAFIWSDGTNYHAFIEPITAPALLAAPNTFTALTTLQSQTSGMVEYLRLASTTANAIGDGQQISFYDSPDITAVGSIEHIKTGAGAYEMHLRTWDGSANTQRLSINGSGVATFAGEVDSSIGFRLTAQNNAMSSPGIMHGTGNTLVYVGGTSGHQWNNAANNAAIMTLSNTGALNVSGALSKSSGTFLIDHPLDPENKKLYHGFVEAPRYDLIYRGKVALVGGVADVEIDQASNMTPGTFAALTQNSEVVALNNLSGFARVKSSAVSGGGFSITCEDASSTDIIHWVVIAERADAFIKNNEGTQTDVSGHLIPEHMKSV